MKNPHPAPFPVQLVDNVLDSCYGEIVLDPFSGSGTTGLSALNHGKKFILIEKSIRYCEMAKMRLEGNDDWRTS